MLLDGMTYYLKILRRNSKMVARGRKQKASLL
jgi:hypothetical protein